jgi:pimeloyl-ACP methyl ester carboxylesterase
MKYPAALNISGEPTLHRNPSILNDCSKSGVDYRPFEEDCMIRSVALASATLAFSLHSFAAHAAPASCDSLAKLALPEATVTAAQDVTSGEFAPAEGGRGPGGGRLTGLPPFCRVALTVAPQIHIEVWLPRDTWNGSYRGEGGGGYAGSISYGGLAEGIRRGYVTASTDTGHPASAGGSFALNADGTLNMPLIADFAERSLREMVVKAKALITAYYGSAPKHSYWNGCSTGGRQGLMAAQRFPEEYDGLVIGAPAINWDRFIPSELWPAIVMNKTVGAPIAAAKLTLATKAAVAACDASDGVTDGLISDPRKCTYDPRALICKSGDDPASCLTTPEADAIGKIWNGPTTASGQRLWFGLERGTPLGALAGNNPFPIATAHFQDWLHQSAAFDWHTLSETDFEADFRASQKKFNGVIGTDDPKLEAFRKHGGKMIIWHGDADPLIFPRGTINYYERVLAANGGSKRVDDFARLFLAPGVGHCGGGDGPSPTGVFEAVVDWVEKGVAPKTLAASRKRPDGTTMSRPLCPYPTTAKWTGTGSTDDAANFACVDAKPPAAAITVR